MAAVSPLAILPDPQLLAIVHAFDVASMEVSLDEEGLIFWYLALEEVARRGLMTEDDRADEADWIVGHLFPAPVKSIAIDRPSLPPGLPGISIIFAGPK